ncbi:MAG: hypothetical protein U0X58_04315 [Flavobacteriaceae bacterium]
MKWLAQILLVLFVTFLATPTIVSLIEKSTDTSYFYSMSEEEQAHKEIKADLNVDLSYALLHFPSRVSKIILSPDCVKHDNLASTIFIPPPELV